MPSRNMVLGSEFTTSEQAYEWVAAEYYDSARHPTCANFREASKRYLEAVFAAYPQLTFGRILEVGAGKSVAAEVLSSWAFQSLQNLVISDSNWQMLEYSRPWSKQGVPLVLAGATNLPFRDSSFDLVISSLGDPYNIQLFWSEVGRVSRRSGHVLFTSPAHAWANQYRDSTRSHPERARFDLQSGRHLDIPSYVYPKARLERLAESVGLRSKNYRVVSTMDIEGVISKKLTSDRMGAAPVVEGYLFSH